PGGGYGTGTVAERGGTKGAANRQPPKMPIMVLTATMAATANTRMAKAVRTCLLLSLCDRRLAASEPAMAGIAKASVGTQSMVKPVAWALNPAAALMVMMTSDVPTACDIDRPRNSVSAGTMRKPP